MADGRVFLYADRTRRLPIADPDDRELTLSCGAALFHLRLGLRYFGWAVQVDILPDSTDPDLLAVVIPEEARDPDESDHALFGAIPRRFTHRGPFLSTPLPPALKNMLYRLAGQEGGHLTCLSGPEEKGALADLVDAGDRYLAADPGYRGELAGWVRTNLTHRPDGIPGYALGLSTPASLVGPLVLRWTRWGKGQGRQDGRLVREAPALGILATRHDDPPHWLAAGQALAAVLLRAAEDDVQAAYHSQPIEVPHLRARLAEAAGVEGHPQLLLRLGYPRNHRMPTPRRPASLVTEGRAM